MPDDALLSLLPSLVALIEEQSVTRAAHRVGISQPRMSARLGRLRALLGDVILVPAGSRRGLIPTDRAVGWARMARSSLDELAAGFAHPSFDPEAADHTFRIMANESATLAAGAPLVQAIRATSGGGVRLAFFSFERSRLPGLEAGELDLVLGRPHQFAELSSLTMRAVLQDRFATIANAAQGDAAIDLDTFCARGHVLISTNPARLHGKVDEALAKLGRRRLIAASVESHLLAIELVASTDLIATIPRRLAIRRRSQVAVLDPPVAFDPFEVTAAWHPRRTGDPAHRWLRETLFSRSFPNEAQT